eukprot:jgi/Mesen1/5093/ME000252S04210
MRALAVLALPLPNRPFIVNAGFLLAIEAELGSDNVLASRAAIEATALLSSEDSMVARFSLARVPLLVDVLAMRGEDAAPRKSLLPAGEAEEAAVGGGGGAEHLSGGQKRRGELKGG